MINNNGTKNEYGVVKNKKNRLFLSKLNVDLPAKRIEVETYDIVNRSNKIIFQVRRRPIETISMILFGPRRLENYT